jgi:hypothetical protein
MISLPDAEYNALVRKADEAKRLREERDRLADALGSCACNCQWVNEQRTYHCRRCEALVSLPDREDAKQQDQGGRQKPSVSGGKA